MKALIDLRTCTAGDKLLSRHGSILTYCGLSGNTKYPHEVEYPEGGYGSRTDDGFVMGNPDKRLGSDHDIVKILAKRRDGWEWRQGGGSSANRRTRRRARTNPPHSGAQEG